MNKEEKTQETLDIVSLINDNPLIKLTGNYGSKIIEKIQEKFDTYEQQLFLANCYCYLNYDTELDFIVKLTDVWKMIGFSRIDHSKNVLIKNFKENVDYQVENFAPATAGAKHIDEARGGHNKENILLTIDCFKKLCLKANTDKANEIHNYYIKLEKIVTETAIEESEELKEQLQIKDKQHENNLILNFKNKQVGYAIRVFEKIIKFGYTNNIYRRMQDHRLEFGPDIILVLIFETVYNREFESMIKNDPVIKPRIIEKIFKTNQTELIQLDDNFTMSHLEKEFNRLKSLIIGDLVANLRKENEELRNELAGVRQELAEYKIKLVNVDRQKIYSKEIDFVQEKVVKKDQYVYQVYNPKDLKLVKTYNTIDDVCGERQLYRDCIRQSVGRAVMNNQVYKGYRFWRINRADERIEYKIPETKEVDRSPKYEQVVQINSTGTEIICIYSCTEDAVIKTIKQGATEDEIRKMKKSVTNNLSDDGLSYGFHWYRLSDAPKELLEKYLEHNTLPDVQINKNSKIVTKYDDKGNIIQTFNSLTEAAKHCGISDTTIRKIIKNQTVLAGCIYN
jgi:phage anti-repressor protein